MSAGTIIRVEVDIDVIDGYTPNCLNFCPYTSGRAVGNFLNFYSASVGEQCVRGNVYAATDVTAVIRATIMYVAR